MCLSFCPSVCLYLFVSHFADILSVFVSLSHIDCPLISLSQTVRLKLVSVSHSVSRSVSQLVSLLSISHSDSQSYERETD